MEGMTSCGSTRPSSSRAADIVFSSSATNIGKVRLSHASAQTARQQQHGLREGLHKHRGVASVLSSLAGPAIQVVRVLSLAAKGVALTG